MENIGFRTIHYGKEMLQFVTVGSFPVHCFACMSTYACMQISKKKTTCTPTCQQHVLLFLDNTK